MKRQGTTHLIEKFFVMNMQRSLALRDRRGTVAMLVGMTAPMLAMAIALGVEVSGWTVTKQRLQRAADVSALAAAQASLGGASAQTAANYGAYLVEMNGWAGTSGTRAWSSGSSLLTDTQTSPANSALIQKVPGTILSSDTAFKVTLQTPVPLLFAGMALSGGTKTISANATAEISTSTSSGGQPCLVALATTGMPINMSGSATLTGYNCTLRSDGPAQFNNNAVVNASAIYASGSISVTGGASVGSTPQFPNSPQIADPYASWAALQSGLTTAQTCTATTGINTGATISPPPGCYNGINAYAGKVILSSAGPYYIQGGINLSGSAVLDASQGVTIFSTGVLSLSGTNTVTLTAPKTGLLAGIAYATSYTGGSSVSQGASFSWTGLFYHPKGSVSISGGAKGGAADCAIIIASAFNISNNTNLAANCGGYGLASFGSIPGTATVRLVQ